MWFKQKRIQDHSSGKNSMRHKKTWKGNSANSGIKSTKGKLHQRD